MSATSEMAVVKVGTGVLTQEDGQLDLTSLERLATALAQEVMQGRRCVLVSSGAVGAGVPLLGLTSYPQEVETRQAAAAVGQARLMHAYQGVFARFGVIPAQVLLTKHDLETQRRRRRVVATLERLLREKNILPIVNENDSVATAELRIGDNDLLSAQVAQALQAEQLLLLSTIEGLEDERGQLIERVVDLKDIASVVREESGDFSIGGMKSKLAAVAYALEQGLRVTIANGREPEQIGAWLRGEGRATRFGVL